MIARILDLLDHAKLARTVILQARQLDHLDRLVADLQAALEVAETAAEEYRSRIPPPRDARSREAEVLSVCEGWRADRERTIAAQLTAAEVELAANRAEIASLRRELADVRRAEVTRAEGIASLRRDLAYVPGRPEPDDTHDTADPPRTLPSNRLPLPEMACTGTGGAE